ncbi:MAG: ankyrin repeat domain-containing protein [Acidimicrobiia bacterium]|nr:ankyrin repeat domain-containing protein [Acidimicrobiia bacterium]
MSAPLFLDAAREGNNARLAELLASDPTLLEARNELGQSAVMLAKYHRQPGAVEFLLAAGAALNLYEACAVGALEKVKEHLASRSRHMDSHAPDGFTPLTLAAFFGNLQVARHLIDQGANINLAASNHMKVAPVHAAAAGGHFRILELLVQNGADVNQPQQQGWRPLHAAAQNGDEPAVRLLLSAGANRQTRADNGQTPLDLAMTRGHAVIASLLES